MTIAKAHNSEPRGCADPAQTYTLREAQGTFTVTVEQKGEQRSAGRPTVCAAATCSGLKPSRLQQLAEAPAPLHCKMLHVACSIVVCCMLCCMLHAVLHVALCCMLHCVACSVLHAALRALALGAGRATYSERLTVGVQYLTD